MEFKFFGADMELWKLHSVLDYARFFFFAAAGMFIFALWGKRISKRRNDDAAAKRAGKKLRRLCKKDGTVLNASQFAAPAGKADALLVSSRGVFALRCIGWGIRVFGSIKSLQWRVEDNKEKRSIPNPLMEISAAAAMMSACLAKKGLDVTVQPLVIFADPFSSHCLNLEGGSCTIAYEDLKDWYRSLPDLPAMDTSTRDTVVQTFTK